MKKKNQNFYYLRRIIDKGVASWWHPSPQLASRHAVQDCIGGESMITCVNLTESGFVPSLRLSSLECLPLDHLGGVCSNCIFILTSSPGPLLYGDIYYVIFFRWGRKNVFFKKQELVINKYLNTLH